MVHVYILIVLKGQWALSQHGSLKTVEKHCNSIKRFYFSAFYTTTIHFKLKDILKELIALYFKNILQRRDKYCKKNTPIPTYKFYDTDINNKFQFFLIDNIFLLIGVRIYQQSIGIPMGNNCAPLLTSISLKHTSSWSFSRETKRSYPVSF